MPKLCRWFDRHNGSIVAFFTFCLFGSTTLLWYETKKLRDDAYDSFETAQRPWVAVDMAIVSDLTYSASGDANITIKFTTRNVGHSPAIDVAVDAMLFEGSPDGARDEREKLYASSRRRPSHFIGYTLFPGGVDSQNISLSFPRAKIEATFKSSSRRHIFAPSLIGCVDYKSTVARRDHHQTAFFANLLIPRQPGGFSVIDADAGTVPSTSLRLVRVGGEFAD